jgi:hypothetical protein
MSEAPQPPKGGVRNKPAYTYCRWRSGYRVDKMTYFPGGSSGEKVAEFFTKEEARAETYRLNGWKPPKN